MKIGYARVSPEDQKLDLQMNALKQAGCEKIYTDHGVSGKILHRPGLNAALARLKQGDTLIVWRLDRLGRSLIGLVQFIDDIGKREVGFVSLTEAIDTDSSGGRLVFHMMAALSEFERSLISERTRAGMDAARRSGRHVGRPPSLTPEEIQEARVAVWQGGVDVKDVAERFNVTPRTIRKFVAIRPLKLNPEL